MRATSETINFKRRSKQGICDSKRRSEQGRCGSKRRSKQVWEWSEQEDGAVKAECFRMSARSERSERTNVASDQMAR